MLIVLFNTLEKYKNRKSHIGNLKWKELLDYDMIKYLLEKVVLNDPTTNCIIRGNKNNWVGLPKSKSLFHTKPDCGLPIGNLTSQLFSNVYLSMLDNYMKRNERANFYGRYVDDFVIVSTDKQELKSMIFRIEKQLQEWGLVLHPRKRYLQHVTKGFDFLGIHQRMAILTPGKRMKHNYLLCLQKYIKDCGKDIIIDSELLNNYLARLNSYLGLMRHCASMQIRKQLEICLLSQKRPYLLLDSKCTKTIINTNLKNKNKV